MNEVVTLFNRAIGAVFDLLLWPWASMSPVWGLVFISVVSGILLVVLYGRVSSQQGLRKVKNRIFAYLLEAVLYRHDLKLCLGAQAKMFGQAFVYVGYAIPPILILMVPCLVVLAQLNLRYDARAFKPGEQGIVEVSLKDADLLEDIALKPSSGLKVTPVVRAPNEGQAFWRIETGASEAQQIVLSFGADEADYVHALTPATAGQALYAHNYKNWLWSLVYPTTKNFTQSAALSALKIVYPTARYDFLGFRMHWLVIFAIVSILSGLVGSKLFGVEI